MRRAKAAVNLAFAEEQEKLAEERRSVKVWHGTSPSLCCVAVSSGLESVGRVLLGGRGQDPRCTEGVASQAHERAG
eukprot:COSAG02_NODE_6319_length_3652_cov_3.466366_2_plen_76_part_00